MTITKHKEGSIRELLTISIPLMLSSFSVMAMIFVDRLLLAHYSTAALNATVNASTFGWAFAGAWLVMTSISEVFVAQNNGAKKFKNIGKPAWQMIWLSLSSILFFIPFAIWGSEWIYHGPDKSLERDYLRWMMIFAPSIALYGSLCGFFIGRGKTSLVTTLAIFANFVNAGLDVLLIFGVDGYIPSMGVKGAAIATSGSAFFQALVLLVIFLKQENREQFGTSQFHFCKKSFMKCLKVGFPNAVFVWIEVLGWAAFYWMMTLVGEKYITIAGICQSMIILFFFIGEGMSKAATAIVGNLIGASRPHQIPQVLQSGLVIQVFFFVIMLACYAIGGDFFLQQFMAESSPELIIQVKESLDFCMYAMFTYLLFEWMRLFFSGILTAAEDTLFLLIAGSLSIWAFLVLPIYFIVVKGGASIETAMIICITYGVASSLVYYLRFTQEKWRQVQLAI